MNNEQEKQTRSSSKRPKWVMEKLARPEPESHAERHYFIAKFNHDKLGIPLDARDHAYLTRPPMNVDGDLSEDIELYEQGYRHDYDILEKLYGTRRDPLEFYIFMMNQREVINDHATDVALAHHKCTAKYHELFIALVAGVEDLRDMQAQDHSFLEYEYRFDERPSYSYHSDSWYSDLSDSGSSGAEESGAEESSPEESSTAESGTEEGGTEESGTENTGAEESGTRESGTKENREDSDEPANVYGSDLDFQDKWRHYHLKREKTMNLCQSLHFAHGKEVKSITPP